MRKILFMILLGAMPLVHAGSSVFGPGEKILENIYASSSGQSASPPPVRSIIQNSAMDRRQVAALAMQQCPGCKILSVTATPGEGAQVYKVKTLSSAGVVRYIFIRGASGPAF